ncbi:MAG: class I SAM-dependent methyltransferase [Anaerolineae bacterium]|nr:class I SAM-dependent methyltransferase [Anaerolineae bacterium]
MVKVRFEERPAGAATMSPDMPNATNYYGWIVSEMMSHLGQCILDVGGGYGAHLEFILKLNRPVLSIDLSETSVQYMRDRFKDYPNFESMALDFGQHQAQDLLIARQFDTITCLNVLEHIEDDLLALKDMHAILRGQRGTLFLLVPAHEWLYGSMDLQAGHYRRYSVAHLRSVLTGAGFNILKLYHFNSFGVLPWFINGRILRQALDTGSVGFQLRLFDRRIVPVLRHVEGRVRLPFGQSLMAVARAG